jgi:hypothetical protein
VLLSQNSVCHGVPHSEVRNSTDFRGKMFLNSSECFSLSLNGSEHVSRSFFVHFMVRNEIPSVFLFYKMVRNGILSIFVLVFFPSTIWFGTEFQLLLSPADVSWRLPFCEIDEIPTE